MVYDNPSNLDIFLKNKMDFGTSLVVQWLRLHLPMQRVQV